MADETSIAQQALARPGAARAWLVGLGCLGAGVLDITGKWMPGEAGKIAYGVAVMALFGALTLVARSRPALRPYWELPLAFFILSVVQVLNNSVPHYVGIAMHDESTKHNPLAATVHGSVIIQLLETAIAIVPIVVLTKLAGMDLGSLYLRPGRFGIRLLAALAGFAVFYLVSARGAHRLIPTNGTVTPARFFTLTPALLVLVISNGFQEELLFRGLFLQKFHKVLGIHASNFLQAGIFALAHIGVTYTASDLVFVVLGVFPLGLLTGYLMRTTDSVLAPAILHAGADIPIYLAFLSYVT